MGHKVNPIGLRLGINRTWDSRWYAKKGEYGQLLHEDLKIREFLEEKLKAAGVSKIVIERPHKKCRVTIHSARPGVVIGKKGADIGKLRSELAKFTASEVVLNIVEIRKPEIDAKLVAESIAQQLERRVAFRRAMKRAVQSAMRLGAGGIRIDCGGRLLLPGLVDAHVHLLATAVRRRQVSLFGLSDLDAVRARLAAAAATVAPGEWLLGWGWDSNRWDEQPTAALLDAIVPDHPVALARMDMHTWWVNGRALALAGVTAATPDPADSHIHRDAGGRPTGLFSEWNAIALIERVVPQPDAGALTEWLAETVAEANRLGLTGIHDQRVEREGAESLRLFQALRRQGRLSLRVHANIAADYVAEAARLGLQAGFGDDNLWLGHVKAFADGAMGSRTALMASSSANTSPLLRRFQTSPAQLPRL